MNITVLGATGRTGRLLVEQLRERGHEVTAVVRDRARAPEGVHVVVGDVRDREVLVRALTGADAVASAPWPPRWGPGAGTTTCTAPWSPGWSP